MPLIAHVDVNACFASYEMQANRYLRGKAIGVVRKPQKSTIVVSPSYEAKAFGVKTGMPTWEALAKCPELELIQGDQAKYDYVSGRLFSILKEFSPLVEVFSIDEAWVDLTQCASAYGGPVEAARVIKRRITEELGVMIRCSVGLAPSKVLSKIASELEKPDGLVWFKEPEISMWLDKLPVTSAYGIDEGLRTKLSYLGIYTLGELGRCDLGRLRRAFGIKGIDLHLKGKGKDLTPLNPEYRDVPQKGYGHSIVFSYPYPTFYEAKNMLFLLSCKACKRLRADGKAALVVHVWVGNDEVGISGQKTLHFPTIDELTVYEACVDLLRERGLTDDSVVRRMGLDVGRVCSRIGLPIPMFEAIRRREQILDALDLVNNKYGDFTTYFASINPKKARVMWKKASIGMQRRIEVRG